MIILLLIICISLLIIFGPRKCEHAFVEARNLGSEQKYEYDGYGGVDVFVVIKTLNKCANCDHHEVKEIWTLK